MTKWKSGWAQDRTWRLGRSLALPLLLGAGAASLSAAEAAAADEVAGAVEADSTVAEDEYDRFGLRLLVGVPDGANAALLVRPLRWLRLHVGGGTNLVSPGVCAGVALVPFDYWVTPVLALEGGRYFGGDVNGLIEKFSGTNPNSAALRSVGYDYANAHVGLEFGGQRFTFFLHGGVGYVRATLDVQEDISAQTGDVTVKDKIVLSGFAAPTAKLGFLFYIL